MSVSHQYNGSANFSHLKGTVELEFSFKVPAAGAVSVIRDGKGAQVASVSAYTAGVYTVTFASSVRLPRQVTAFSCSISQPAAGTGESQARLTTESLDALPASGTLGVVCTETTDDGVPNTILQPATGSWVSVMLKGPRTDDGKDAA